ncbi:MAG: ribulose-phosphate 3-epimerase [Clostridia bacterium]|nr:ribulose-phosphate 3-epimerase [Clostridia bacterium]
MYKIGIDIGGTKINIGIFSENKILLKNKKTYIKDIDNLIQFIHDCIMELCSECNVNYNDILSVGVGIPGTVSKDGKRILKAPNIDLLNENFAGNLEEKLNIPVCIVQDSRAAAWGEYLCGAGKNAKSVVCVTLGTGIGTGIVTDGKIYAGDLGCAGEIGHLPTVENGRQCGCGKRGCLEKYCAGGGLDITAIEILGSGHDAKDLFNSAMSGDENSKKAISEAVEMLGRALVSITNLLSVDCLLFSGGLCEQEDLYLNPLIDYIKEHCYYIDQAPVIKKGTLGENSPLYGAAFIPMNKKRKYMLSASIMCADILNMGKALSEIKDSGIDYIHCDIMDNHFVPNLMLPTEMLNTLRKASDLPFDFHIMAENPEMIIEKLELRKNDIVSVHYESTNHLQRVISVIKNRGARAAVAINPATPINVLEEIISELDMVLIMSVNPGFSGQKIVGTSFEKIKKMRKFLDENGQADVIIEVDGNCSYENVPKMYAAGADIFVVGTSSVFNKDNSIKQGVDKLKNILHNI